MADPDKKPAKKKAPTKDAPATQKISKAELAELIKKAEQEDPEADEGEAKPAPPPKKK
jgi:hypothetical protein